MAERPCKFDSYCSHQCGRGEIGKHTRFRFWRPNGHWEFDSPRPHFCPCSETDITGVYETPIPDSSSGKGAKEG